MTFDNDMVQLEFNTGERRRVFCKEIGLEWPPPETINCLGVEFQRVKMSQLTDEQRQEAPFVMRGALYRSV